MGEPSAPVPLVLDAGHDAAGANRSRPLRLVRWGAASLLTVGVVAVAVVFHGTAATALRGLRTPAPGWLAGAVGAEMASMGFYARMQRRLLRGAGTTVTLRRAVSLAYAAHSMSMTLPGGPLVSTIYNYRRMRGFGADSVVAAWATAASGILSGIGLALLGVGVGAVAAADDTGDLVTTGLVVAAGALVVVGAGTLRRHPAWRRVASRPFRAVVSRLPAAQTARLAHWTAWFRRLLEVRIPPRHLVAASAHSILNWVTDGVCLGMCAMAVGVAVHPLPLAATYLAGMTVSSLPLIPGGLGTVDSALIVGLVASGAHTSSALTVVVLYRLISFALIGGIGWAVWLVGRTRRLPSAADEPAAVGAG